MQAHHLNTNQHGPADLYSRVLYSIPPKWVNLPITVLRTCPWSTVLAKTHRIQISHCGGSRSVSQSERLTAPRAHKLLSPRDWHLGAIAPNAQSRCCTKSGSWHLRRQPSQYVQNWSCYLFFLRGFVYQLTAEGSLQVSVVWMAELSRGMLTLCREANPGATTLHSVWQFSFI